MKASSDKDSDAVLAERALVKQWTAKIKAAKKRFEPDFQRMLKNMEFCAGYQWEGQEALHTKQYVANITLREISQKVSTLYARDPQAVPRRRERLNYQLWDGKMESLIAAMGVVQQTSAMGMPPPPEAMALMQDFQAGQQWEQMLDKVAQTMKILYHYQMDEQEPEFKEQLKQLVAYTAICGVGYARMSFVRDMTTPIGSTALGGDLNDRVKLLHGLTEQYTTDNSSASSAIVEQMRLLASSLINTMQDFNPDSINTEKIVWDFPSPLSIIVDPNCKALMGFIGAKWQVQEYLLPITVINAYFELRGDAMVKAGADITKYDPSGKEKPNASAPDMGDPNAMGNLDLTTTPLACLFEVFDNTSKERFFIVDGHKDYVMRPEALEPKTRRFWPIFALTFNRIVCDRGQKATVYPPSDVDLIRPMQKEWNRSREGLRDNRISSAPVYCAPKGLLTDEDKAKIRAAEPFEVIELAGVPPGTDMKTVLQRLPVAAIEPAMYDSTPLLQDVNLTVGAQAADLGQPQKHTSATAEQISEQARGSTIASNVDDLDGFLTRMARAGGEMLLREMSPDTVKKIVGQGAVWPSTPQDRENFLNQLYLETEAASTGRPNQALDMKKWQAAAPVLQAAGANPQFMVRQTLKTLDSRIEPAEAFPLVPTAPPAQGPAAKPSQPGESQGQQPQANPGQQPQNPRNEQQAQHL